ncbi:gamma-glutamyl-gamma-aminobutyrate hydrolase family protein [Caldicellulosiruptoraceae bacterium PP1]
MNVLIFCGYDFEKHRLYCSIDYYEPLLKLNCDISFFPSSKNSISKLEQYIKNADALLFCGGEDVHPQFYKSQPLKGIGRINILRDKIEIEAMKIADRLNKRVLAICRGIQIMNVAFGGDLIQDINSSNYPLSHWQNTEVWIGYHSIFIEGKKLYNIFKSKETLVNSFHHQAVNNIASGFSIEARSSDGIIEAISKNDKEFFIGVQWHPESMWQKNENQFKLFKEFVGVNDG